MSNFAFIPSSFGSLSATPLKAEQHVHHDAPYTAFLCRKSLEEWVRWMYEHDGDLELPYDTSLNSLIHAADFQAVIAPSFFHSLNTIRKLGNDAAHSNKKIPPLQALHVLKLLHSFVGWVVNVYGDDRVTVKPFDEGLLPRGDEAEKTRKELQALLDNYHAQQQKIERLEKELEATAAQKQQNLAVVPPPIDPNEALTRKIYIDTLLREAGWDPYGPNVAEYAVKNCMPTALEPNGNGRVDYVLWGDDGKPLAIVEAKRTTVNAKVGQHQAKCYADCLQKEFGQRPVIFFTNGFRTFLWDDSSYPPREVYGFYTKDELHALILRRSYKKNLASEAINQTITERYYQHEAIRNIAELLQSNRREALLVMATGTGKTRVAASLIDFLSKAGWIKRALFLADRNALIHQAKTNLNDYLPQLPAVDLTKEKEDESSRIVFSTYQTIINMIDGEMDEQQRVYGVGHFDIIIFDEIHRSVYNRYKHIFKYFDGIRIGLTATPRSETDRDTYGLFNMEPNNPTYAYEIDEAVNDGFLVPPKALSVPVKFQRKGIKYAELSDEEKLRYEEEFADPVTGQFPNEIEAAALNAWLFNIDTVDKVIGHVMANGIKVEGGDKLAKTIIFARSHDHAIFIEERFNVQYPEYKGDFLKVIDYRETYKYDLLNKFKVKEKMPQIAVSVDMLDTGIDVPEVCNLVFFKPVRIKVKLWQMVGRGTRLCKNLFGPSDDKKEFVIFDFCENLEFFNANPKGFEGTSGKSLSQRLFELRLRLAVVTIRQQEADVKAFGESLLQILIDQTQALNTQSFLVRMHWEHVETYRDANQWNALSDLDIRDILDHIAPLVVETDQDELAKRFDVLMLDLQHFILQSDKRQVKIIQQVMTTAGRLTKKASIPAVASKMETLRMVQNQDYWKGINILGVERIRTELRDIMKFLESEGRPVVYTNYLDEFDGEVKDYQMIYGINELNAYKGKIEGYLREHANHLTVHKLRNNQPITSDELRELERLLFEQGTLGTRQDFVTAYGEQPLGLFIRSILGLDAEAAKKAFGELLVGQTFNAQQIRFIDTLINFFSVKGVIEPEMLFESPFTDINISSISGLFDEETSTKIIDLIQRVNGNAGVG